MKRDLFIGGTFVLLAALGIGAVVYFYGMRQDEHAPKTIAPKFEPIARLPEKEIKGPVKKGPVETVRKIPIKAVNAKTIEPTAKETPPIIAKKQAPKKEEPKQIAKVEPAKKEPTAPVKIETKVDDKVVRVTAKEIVLGNITKLNNPDGEYVVKPLDGDEVILIGKIKTLTIGGANGASLDASGLDAQEIIFAGEINGKAKVLLHAPKGTVHFQREINGRSQIDVIAPEGTVVFKSTHASIINGESKLTIVAKDVQFLGDINGMQTTVDVTLTKDGSLKFVRILGGVKLHYSKADAGDPEPRIDSGVVGPAAQLRKLELGKR